MMSSRKVLAAALVAAQILLPGSGSYQAMAAGIAGRAAATGGQSMAIGVAGMAHMPVSAVMGAPMTSSGLRAALSTSLTPAPAMAAPVAAAMPGDRQPAAATSRILGDASGIGDAAAAAADHPEASVAVGRQHFDQAGSHAGMPASAVAASQHKGAAFSGSLAAASEIATGDKGGSSVPAPKTESKFKVSTLVDAVIAGFVYIGYKGIVLPMAIGLGYVAFTLGVDVPLNLPHYIVAAPGYALEWSSSALGYAAPMVESVSTGLSNFANSTGVLPEVYGTLAKLGGYASGAVSSAMAAVVQPIAAAGQWLVSTAAPAMVVNTKAIMNAIPAEWWWFGPAVVANYRKAKANDWKIGGGLAQRWVESKTSIPGVSFLGWATDAVLINPALFMRDIARDVIKPLIRPFWNAIKDAAQWVYDYPLTYLGHTLRGVGVGTFSTVATAIISPFILAAAFLMNYMMTPTYRALRTMTRTKTGLAILLGGAVLFAAGGFLGLYSLANLAAYVVSASPLIATGLKGAWWMGATVTGAMGFGVGAYYGFKNKFVDAAKLTYNKVIGTTLSWLAKAMDTFKQAHQDTQKS